MTLTDAQIETIHLALHNAVLDTAETWMRRSVRMQRNGDVTLSVCVGAHTLFLHLPANLLPANNQALYNFMRDRMTDLIRRTIESEEDNGGGEGAVQ